MPVINSKEANKIIALAMIGASPQQLFKYYDLVTQSGALANLLEMALENDLPQDLANELLPLLEDRAHLEKGQEMLTKCNDTGIAVVAYGEPHYPLLLTEIYQPPPVLFCRGEVSKLAELQNVIAIVGSRKADNFGCELASEFASFTAKNGICVVSGLAHGVDTHAHRGALERSIQVPTVAVLGNGLNSVYPRSNQALAEKIIEKGGLIISQFLPDEPPYPSNFLNRNRIIAGLAQVTLVIQAPERSGSLATARNALEESREVLVVPGAINDPRYSGSLRLIQSGAHLLMRKEEILDFYSIKNDILSEKQCDAALSDEQRLVIERLRQESSVHYSALTHLIADSSKLAVVLLELEMAGIIVQEPGNMLRLKTT